MAKIENLLADAGAAVRRELEVYLHIPDGPESRLFDAMRHIALGDGKAFRPFLCLETARLFEVEEARGLQLAAAIECVHCYSLVHDDLPSMDDDDMRRGVAATHKAFDEATAILAGDALLTLAFEILAHEATHKETKIRLDLISGLAQAAGMHGMVGGQMMDVLSSKLVGELALDAGGLTRLQKMKTGALISFAVDGGAILGHAREGERHALSAYAHDIGLAYQIADDLLDFKGDEAETGTPQKTTFASLLGVERAEEQMRLLATQAVGHLAAFGDMADGLRQAAAFVIARRH